MTGKPQFSLQSLLWFVLAFGVYASEMAFLFDKDWNKDWRTPATILLTWVILGVYYLGNGFRSLFVTHCLGPGSFVPLTMIFLPEETSFFATFCNGCLLGNQISFPIFVLALIVRLFEFIRQYIHEYDR
jgi:hypothetical protein